MQTIKYQIFISSPYKDLQKARDQVIKAVLEMGHIPVGMEMFSAADDEQWKIITRQIDQSDYYVVILAHRYGSVTSDGLGYTEKEYDYAVQNGIPVIGFILDDAAEWPANMTEDDPDKRRALNAFKDKVKRKPVGFWTSVGELHGKFSIAFGKLINTNPRPGWIRVSDVPGPEVVSELSRLSSENAMQRRKLEELNQPNTAHFAQGTDIAQLPYSYHEYFNGSKIEEEIFEKSWNEIFIIIAQASLHNANQQNIHSAMWSIVHEHLSNKLQITDGHHYYPQIDDLLIKIRVQLLALELIDIQYSSDSPQPMWILTLYGVKHLTELLAIRRSVTSVFENPPKDNLR